MMDQLQIWKEEEEEETMKSCRWSEMKPARKGPVHSSPYLIPLLPAPLIKLNVATASLSIQK